MQGLYNSYFWVSRRDIVSKSKGYVNINEVSHVKFLLLKFLNLRNKAFALLGLSFLFLLTNKKGKVLSVSRKSFSKNIGCFLRLGPKDSLDFLERFLLLNFYRVMELEDGFSKKSLSKTGTFSFTIEDIHVFSELGDDLFKFRQLKNLTVSIIFSHNNLNSNLFLLESIGFNFKN